MTADVLFLSLEQDPGLEFAPVDPRPGLDQLVQRLGLEGAARGGNPWGLKVSVGGQGHPPAVDPGWARRVADTLAGPGNDPGHIFCFDTLSITTAGLDTPETHLGLAQAKGFGTDRNGLAYRVPEGALESGSLAETMREMAGTCLLSPVRPHPHAGFQGALVNLGVGLSDRQEKIELHRDIRPNVDTPLCAGCGSCLAVCIFDAIAINAGRAFIDHTKCTGCGECMNVCFMAGISAEDAAGIPRFQRRVAEAGEKNAAALNGVPGRRIAYFNFLVRLDRHAGGARARGRRRLGDVGVLASFDPVALDRATWDLITEKSDGNLSAWSGFQHDPEVLIAEAAGLGLGTTAYRLVGV